MAQQISCFTRLWGQNYAMSFGMYKEHNSEFEKILHSLQNGKK